MAADPGIVSAKLALLRPDFDLTGRLPHAACGALHLFSNRPALAAAPA
jgi:hypothetical protein